MLLPIQTVRQQAADELDDFVRQIGGVISSASEKAYSQAHAAYVDEIQYNRLPRVKLYPHQMRMFERDEFTIINGVMAANRTGKTYGVCYALACHLIGWYPSWWRDIKYKQGVKITCAGASSDQIKQAYTETLFGTTDKRQLQELGTGLIPRKNILMESMISGHSASEVKEVRIIHNDTGTESQLKFVSFEQAREVLQGGKDDIVSFDEQPPDEIVSELMRGISITPSGQEARVYCAFTPLNGRTSFVDKLLTGAPQYSYTNFTWDDLPEEMLPQRTKEALLATFLPWEIDARTKGIPSQGEGAVFAVRLRECTYKPQDVQMAPQWRRCMGMDFGRSPDPTTGVYVAFDRDKDIIYVYDAWEVTNQTPVEYQAQITARGKWPIAWPPDGKRKGYTETSSVVEELRFKYGARLLADHFTNPDGGNSIDYGLQYILQRLRTGRLLINASLEGLLREMEGYHVERTGIAGKLVFRGKDHLIDALRYAALSVERYGQSELDIAGFADNMHEELEARRFMRNLSFNTSY